MGGRHMEPEIGGIMVSSTAKPAMPWFGLAFAASCTILIFFGFSFTFFSRVISSLRPLVLYAHVATAASWVILVVVQAALAMRRKLALHRRIGEWGFRLGAFAALSAFATALALRRESVLRTADEARRVARLAFLSIPLNGAIAFSALLACAYVWRHKPAIHRRCILLGAATLTLPAVARIPEIGDGPWVAAPTDGFMLLLVAVDLIRERRLHPVHWIAVPLIVALQQFSAWLFQARPEWWVQTASFLCGL